MSWGFGWQGASLKQREVLALRRTSRDLLTFPLFAAILIAPLTPVGHVLIFSFIQQYFPALFPSQFAERRQVLLQRYVCIVQLQPDASRPTSLCVKCLFRLEICLLGADRRKSSLAPHA